MTRHSMKYIWIDDDQNYNGNYDINNKMNYEKYLDRYDNRKYNSNDENDQNFWL